MLLTGVIDEPLDSRPAPKTRGYRAGYRSFDTYLDEDALAGGATVSYSQD